MLAGRGEGVLVHATLSTRRVPHNLLPTASNAFMRFCSEAS